MALEFRVVAAFGEEGRVSDWGDTKDSNSNSSWPQQWTHGCVHFLITH